MPVRRAGSASLPVSAQEYPDVAFDLLDAPGRKLEGSPAARIAAEFLQVAHRQVEHLQRGLLGGNWP